MCASVLTHRMCVCFFTFIMNLFSFFESLSDRCNESQKAFRLCSVTVHLPFHSRPGRVKFLPYGLTEDFF